MLEYRLRIRNQADSGNLLILSSRAGDTNCLLTEAPTGDGQRVDIFEGRSQIGAYTWRAIDRDDGGSTRTITSKLADVDARNQMLSNRAIGEYSVDGGSWTPFHSGYVNSIRLPDALVFEFTVGDTDRREQTAELFRALTDAFDRVSCIIGGPVVADPPVAWSGTPKRAWGPVIDYGPARFQVIANPSGLLDSTNRITLSLISGNFPPFYPGQQTAFSVPLPLTFGAIKVSIAAEEIDRLARPYFEWDGKGDYRTNSSQAAQPWGSFPGLEVKMTAVVGGAVTRSFPIAQETTKRSSITPVAEDYPIGDYSALVANSNKRLIVAWDVATMGAQPSVGTQFDVLVYPRAIDDKNPLHVRGHVIDIHTALNDQEGIPYNPASAAATKAALGPLFLELQFKRSILYKDLVARFKGAFGYATRYNEDGEQEFFPTRAEQPLSVGTLALTDLIAEDREGPTGVIYSVDEKSVIAGVDYRLRAFRLWNPKVDEGDRPMDGAIEQEQLIEGRRLDTSAFGDRVLVYDVPGEVLLSGGLLLWNQAFALREWVLAAGDVIIDRAGHGQTVAEDLEVLNTVPGKVGDYLDVEVPHQVNALSEQDPTAQRGGSRRMQIIGRTEQPGTSVLQLLDAGLLAQDAPEPPDEGTGGNDPNDGIPVPELSLAASDDAPLTTATVTVDNALDITPLNGDVHLEYAVQELEPTEAGTAWGPVRTSEGLDELDLPAIASGATIWVRGQTRITATGQQSEWSDWISLTLGPDSEGEGDTLPPIALALAIDPSTGELSAVASGVPEIVKVYFLAGAVGGAPPTFADVIATGSTDSSAPFTAAALATMAEGETRTVGGVGEDSLGNRTALVTESITRAVDTGSGSGTPGDFSILFRAGPALVIDPVAAAVTHHAEADTDPDCVSLRRSRSVRLKVPVLEAFPAGTKVALQAVRFAAGTWRYLNTTSSGPFVAVDVVNTLDWRPIPNVGDYFEIDEEWWVDNVFLDWVTVGGDGSGSGVLGNVRADFRTSAAPPASELPDPELPQPASLFFEGYLTEGSGQSVANKKSGSGGLPAMELGATSGVEANDTTWATGPRRMLCPALASFQHTHCRIPSIPSVAGGFAYFLPYKITAGPGSKYLTGLAPIGGRGRSGHLLLDVAGGPFVAHLHEDTGGAGGTLRAVSGTTLWALNTWYLLGLVFTGTALKIVVNGVVENSLAFANPALSDAGGGEVLHLGWASNNLSFATGPDNCEWGDPLVYVAAGIDFTSAELLEMYARFKLTYPDLP